MEINDPIVDIREAREEDFNFVSDMMQQALEPYYGGDHRAHAQRIFSTHISGGKDQIGHFSFEQKIFIITKDDKAVGLINLVGKRQGTYKISPIIIAPQYQGKLGLGRKLLEFAEDYAKSNKAREIYCTVAEENRAAFQFFIKNGYIIAGRSDSHFKSDITETMLYKLFSAPDFDEKFEKPNISVHPLVPFYEPQVRKLLLDFLPGHFRGVDLGWIDALFEGYDRRQSRDINLKYKLIYVAIDRDNNVLGVAGATPKKSERPIKIMPFIATTLSAFVALLVDVPYFLKPYGCRLYIHITPSIEETIALQQYGWRLDAVMPAAYHEKHITQQWSLDIARKEFYRLIRTKQRYLDFIKKGQKTLEVRVGYEHIKTIQPGESVKFCSRVEALITIVKAIRKYSTIEEMLEYEEAGRIIPNLSKSEVLKILREIYPVDLEKLGIIVLEIEKK